MRNVAIALGVLCLCLSAHAGADSYTPTLKNNPFNQPNLIASTTSLTANHGASSIWRGQLQATLVSGENSLANVDGKLIEIGESYNGYQLLDVGEGTATFAKEDLRITLVVGGDEEQDNEL